MRAGALALALAACGGGGGGAIDAREVPDSTGAPDALRPIDGATPLAASGVSWPEADGLFHQDPRWLGADAAYSIDLGGGRVAWLFGDTFVATSDAHLRTQSAMPRNTVAVETGLDPTTATMQFAWATKADGSPGSFFPEDGTTWHWPAGGVRFPDGPLAVVLMTVIPTTTGLHFAITGWQVALVANPDAAPAAWQVTYVDPPTPANAAIPGAGIAIDGGAVDLLADDSAHAAWLAQVPAAALAAGDLSSVTWSPAAVMSASATEGSLHQAGARWLQVESRGFGATTIAVREAATPAGAWSPLVDAFTPPESSGANPFVYAGKAHPELTTPDGTLAATYATNSFTFADLLTPDGQANLYWPRFVWLTVQ